MQRNFSNFQANLNKMNSNPKLNEKGFYNFPFKQRMGVIPFNPLNYHPNQNRVTTNNYMIFANQKRSFQPPKGLSSSSMKMKDLTFKMERSGTKIKIKSPQERKDNLLSPSKTEVSVSGINSANFSPPRQIPLNNYIPVNSPPFYDNSSFHYYPNQFLPMKTPNFNKNYYPLNSEKLFKPINSVIDSALEKEILKKVMQIFLRMDSIRKKEVEIYKKKLIPLFEKLNVRSHRMKTIQDFLQNFLMGQKISQRDVDSLNISEKLIFMAFLVKKKFFDVDCFEFTPESITFFQNRMTSKRNEQEYKIVLKKAFKTMINAFNQDKGFYDNSKRHFYQEYFGDFAKVQAIPLEDLELENLFNEKGKAHKKKRKSKKNYAQILKTSPAFLKTLSEYLDNKFTIGHKITGSKNDAIREIKKKVPDLVNKWKTRILLEEDNLPHIQMSEFFGKFFINKKVKLPWSVHEISRAVKSVKNLLQIN